MKIFFVPLLLGFFYSAASLALPPCDIFTVIRGGLKDSEVSRGGFKSWPLNKQEALSILRAAIVSQDPVLFFKNDPQHAPSIHVATVESIAIGPFGSIEVNVVERTAKSFSNDSDASEIRHRIPFSQMDVIGDGQGLEPIFKPTASTPATIDVSGLAEYWQDNFRGFSEALKLNKWVRCQRRSGHPNDFIMARVAKIEQDPAGAIVVTLIDINGSDLSAVASLIDFEQIHVLDSFTDLKNPDPTPALPGPLKNPVRILALDRHELERLELMTPDRKQLLAALENAAEKDLPIVFFENGIPHQARVHEIIADNSYMPIITLTDLEHKNPIYRTLKGIESIAPLPKTFSSEKEDPIFANAWNPVFNVTEETLNTLPESWRPVVLHWKSALQSGALVEWDLYGMHRRTGRIEKVYEEESGEIIVVVRLPFETYVSTIDGIFSDDGLASVAKAVSNITLRLYPVMINDDALTGPRDARIRISEETRLSMKLFGATYQKLEVLQQALLNAQEVDFRPTENAEDFIRAKVLQIDFVFGGPYYTVLIEGESDSRVFTDYSIFDLQFAKGEKPRRKLKVISYPKPVLNAGH